MGRKIGMAGLCTLFALCVSTLGNIAGAQEPNVPSQPPTPSTPPATAPARGTPVTLTGLDYDQAKSTWMKGKLWKTHPHPDVLKEGGISKFYVPIFIKPGIFTKTSSWSDWNRLGSSVVFIRKSGTRSFVTIQSKGRRLTALTYAPDEDNKYNLLDPPAACTLNRQIYESSFDDLVGEHNALGDIFDPGRFFWLFGFSPEGFLLGGKDTEQTEPSKVAYMIGGAYMINPSVALNYGVATMDGRKFVPGFGLNFDFSLIGELFK